MNLHNKLIEIRKAFGTLTKDSSGHQHKYVSGSQLLSKLRSAIDTMHLRLNPEIVHGSTNVQVINNLGKQNWNADLGKFVGKAIKEVIVSFEMYWVWTDPEDNEQIRVPWFATAQMTDASQSLGSALTYSERYFLTKYFNLPTDEYDPDDPGNDTHGGVDTTPAVQYLPQNIFDDVMNKHNYDYLKRIYNEWNDTLTDVGGVQVHRMILPQHKKELDSIIKKKEGENNGS